MLRPQGYLQGCQLIVLVPSRELGVQLALLCFKLFGGSISQGVPGQRSNMFRYAGPRGLQVLPLLRRDTLYCCCDCSWACRQAACTCITAMQLGVGKAEVLGRLPCLCSCA